MEMESVDFQSFRSPTFGVLLPRALMYKALGTNEYQVRKVHKLLKENDDFVKIKSETDFIERVFYTPSGLYKLCDSISTANAQEFKSALAEFLLTQQFAVPVQTSSSPATVDPTLTAMPASAVQQPSAVPRIDGDAGSLTVPEPIQLAHFKPRSYGMDASNPLHPAEAGIPGDDPTVRLGHAIGASAGNHIARAVMRLQGRPENPSQSTDAETLMKQQRLTMTQLQEMQDMLLRMQQSGADQAQQLLNALPTPAPTTLNVVNSVRMRQEGPPGGIETLKSLLRIESTVDLIVTGLAGLLTLIAAGVALNTIFKAPRAAAPPPVVQPAQPVPPAPAAPQSLPSSPVPPQPIAPQSAPPVQIVPQAATSGL